MSKHDSDREAMALVGESVAADRPADGLAGSTGAGPGPRPDSPRCEEPDLVMARRIAGVRIERLAGYHDHRGSLTPFLDYRSPRSQRSQRSQGNPFWSEPVVYGYTFTVRPGRIKGWGRHLRQADRYFVVAGDLRVVLFDGRNDSTGSPDSAGSPLSTDKGNFCEFFFTGQRAGLLLIPPGVWHATQNWGRSLGRVINFPTHRFDSSNPDKMRLDPHSGAIPFDWRLPDF
jgi:dTDP-4-dehydrorhamnose 3,5-epimerase